MRDRYGSITEAILTADLRIFGLSFMTFVAIVFITSFRLKLIAEAQEIRINVREAASLTFIGYFFNNFLPTAIGGDVVKAYYLSKKSGDNTGSYTSVFIDRAIGLVTMILMAFAALFFIKDAVIDDTIRYSVYAITAVSLAGIFFMVNKSFASRFTSVLRFMSPIENKLRKAYNAVNKYRSHRMLMFKATAISVISQLLYFTTIGLLAFSIGSRVSAVNILIRMPAVCMISLLPSVNGLGVREGATVLMFGPLIGKEEAFVVSILLIVMLLMISIIGGLIYALSPQFKVKFKDVEKGDGA